MKYEDLPLETRKCLQEILRQKKEEKLPGVGDCFFLKAPTLRPQAEPDHALVATIGQRGDTLICAKMSLEYWEASEYDYMLDPDEWSAGYPAIVEVWNSILFKPSSPVLIHASIPANSLQIIKSLFSLHQRGQSPPKDFRGIGNPLPDDLRHRGWRFRSKEAQVMERVRRHYHEGWDVRVIRLAWKRPARELLMAAETGDLAFRLSREIRAQLADKEILGPPDLEGDSLYLRRDDSKPGYTLLWYSPEGKPPPEVSGQPPMTSGEVLKQGAVQAILGSWRDEELKGKIVLEVRKEGLWRELLIQLPRSRK